MADVQLFCCFSNPSVLLNQSVNFFNIFCHSWSGWIAQVLFMNDTFFANLDPFHPLVRLPLHNSVFSVLC
jgi:hypothetical protein